MRSIQPSLHKMVENGYATSGATKLGNNGKAT